MSSIIHHFIGVDIDNILEASESEDTSDFFDESASTVLGIYIIIIGYL